MKKNIIIALFCIILSSLYAKSKLPGIYIERNNSKKLILKEKGDYILINQKSGMLFYESDTLSYGKWSQRKGFLILKSDYSIMNTSLELVIKESILASNDSIRFKFLNPSESLFEKFKNNEHYEKWRFLRYVIHLECSDTIIAPTVNSNYFAFKKSSNNTVYDFMIVAIPDANLINEQITVNSAHGDYSVNDTKSNLFEISIPNLKLEFFTYIRYNNEYFPINGKKIVIRGEEFFKE